MNYQYRFGTSFSAATRTLYLAGGYGRYYQGMGAALVQGKSDRVRTDHRLQNLTTTGPISRFGDTAANAGILALLQSNTYLKNLPSPIKTVFASLWYLPSFPCLRRNQADIVSAASFRMILTPIDTLKTTLQVHGAGGTSLLRQRIKINGVGSLWWGAFATAVATFVGHYPWFATVSRHHINRTRSFPQYSSPSFIFIPEKHLDNDMVADFMTVQFPLRHYSRT